jgi:hypothetical protein
MKTSRFTKKFAAALAPIALAGAALAPTAAASTHPVAHGTSPAKHARVGRSDTPFHILNHSSQTIRLSGVTGSGNYDPDPQIGTTLQPGQGMDIYPKVKAFTTQNDQAIFQWGQSSQYALNVDMKVDAMDVRLSDGCSVVGPNGQKDVPFTCVDDVNGYTGHGDDPIVLLDAPNTQVPLGPDQKQAQADALKQFCDTGVGQCSFTPTKEEHTVGTPVPAGSISDNYYDNEMDKTIKAGNTVGVSDSLGIEVSAGVEKIVSVGVSYEHEWHHDHTFDDEETAKVPAHTSLWYCHQPAVIRDTGDFTATMGNTTWHITGVSYDSPDLTKDAVQDHYFYNEEPLPNPKPAGYCTIPPAAQFVK